MNALFLTIFVSLGIAVLAVLLFLFSSGQRDADHADRLALLPLDEDTGPPPTPTDEGAKP